MHNAKKGKGQETSLFWLLRSVKHFNHTGYDFVIWHAQKWVKISGDLISFASHKWLVSTMSSGVVVA